MAVVSSVFSQPGYWITLILLGVLLLLMGQRLAIRWRAASFLRIGLIALVLFGIFLPHGDLAAGKTSARQVLIVDQSDSLDPQARQDAQAAAKAWQAGGENRMVVAFGAKAEPVLPEAETWPEVDGRASDLSSAVLLAQSLLGEGQGRLLAASDGLSPLSSAAQSTLQKLKERGSRVDFIALSARGAAGDGYVGALNAPVNLWAGMQFDVTLAVFPPPGGKVESLELKINGETAATKGEDLGGNEYRFHVPALDEGMAGLEVTAAFSGSEADPFPANNSAYAAVQVFAAPRVLLVSANPASNEVGNFLAALRSNNLKVEVVPPRDLPTALAELSDYRVIFLHNLLSNQISNEQMQALQVFTERLAGGLVFLGGRSSYTLGGYQDTLLEPLLPVKLEPPPRAERPPIVFNLVLDRSSSMSLGVSLEGPKPIDLAREAAMRAIETLRPEDYLGVLTFSDENRWDVPLRPAGSGLALREALDAVSRVEALGGTNMYAALQEAVNGMLALPAEAPSNRYLLLLSDGQSSDGSPEEFLRLVETAHQARITISTIAIGEDADSEGLSAIADAGGGRFYQVTQAEDLPRILIYESQAARSENVQSGQTGLKAGEPGHPILLGLPPSQFPILSGYNALSSKKEQGAEDILLSASFDDPILSAWQVGLGRVLAWTGDLGEEWTGEWPQPENAGRFWAQVVRYALVNPAFGPAQVDVQVGAVGLLVEAALFDPSGGPLNLLEAQFVYAGPDGEQHNLALSQTSAGVYHLEMPRPAEGAYRAVVAYQNSAGERVEATAPFAVNPPDEWLPGNPAAGRANLDSWANLAGGQVVSLADLAAGDGKVDEAPKQGLGLSGWQWVLLGLVLFWPLEIALRRRWLPWA